MTKQSNRPAPSINEQKPPKFKHINVEGLHISLKGKLHEANISIYDVGELISMRPKDIVELHQLTAYLIQKYSLT